MDKDTRELIAEACKDIMLCEENEKIWRKMKSVVLNASDEDIDKFMKEIGKRRDCFEILGKLNVQMNFITILDNLCDARDIACGDYAVFQTASK